MADAHLVRLVVERRKRLVASVLGFAEREFFDQLTPDQRAEFRDKVLHSADEFTDLMRDILKVVGEDIVVNDHVVTVLEQIHANTRRR